MKLSERIRRQPRATQQRSALTLTDLASMVYAGHSYPLGQVQQTMPGDKAESIGSSFQGYVQGAYQSNGVVFACMAARQRLFSEARLQFRQIRKGRPGDLFGTPALRILEKPWENGTTGDLLARMMACRDLAGNAYVARRGSRANPELRVLRPDWVDIVLGSKTGHELDTEVVGYAYWEGGVRGGSPLILLPGEVAHWAPTPDPLAKYRGMSWLSPVIREVQADSAMREHKISFLEHGATPNLVVSFASDVSPQAANEFIDRYQADHQGALNAYKTLFMGAGADIKPVGTDMRQLDFKVVQGAGETRVASAAGVPPIVIGLSEGLAAATYSNYGQARRAFSDGTMRPEWRSACGALASIVDVPKDAELWYDARDISFLQEDEKDAAEIEQTNAITVRAYVDAGFDPDAVIAAVAAQDLTLLTGQHSGWFSVQLQQPGSEAPKPLNPPPSAPAK